MPDHDGYPTEAELNIIRNWQPAKSYNDLMEYVQELWYYPNYFMETEIEGNTFYVFHTGGWSGNESLIEALQSNLLFWVVCWYQSTVGGHFTFQVQNTLNA